jgi:hypothetical protein
MEGAILPIAYTSLIKKVIKTTLKKQAYATFFRNEYQGLVGQK